MKRLAQILAAAGETGVEVANGVSVQRTGGHHLVSAEPVRWGVNWSAFGTRPAEEAAAFARDLTFAAELAQRLTEAEA